MDKRLFIAANISEQTRSLIRAIQSDLHFMKNDIRFVSPQNIHLTLKFLGDVPVKQISQIVTKIESSISSFQNFTYICDGTGVFPNPNRPRVLWLGITDGSENLKKLSELLNIALNNMPVQQEDKEYRSHITLGRAKGFKESRLKLNEFLNYQFEKIANPVTELVLFESILRPKGAIYTPLHRFKLK
ncbi:RNA 2',3'-cyclic phosphodiesterase [bacterium]|nr:RNA 2',3'-cyclic phosphodiesterase [bacterium]MBU1065242.1 RNA 2',3'-cyclic phosphodiesterase [bacterium]MBU1873783.1 RNA 2',3'-cyclic phosphodiesterase [bacterium]